MEKILWILRFSFTKRRFCVILTSVPHRWLCGVSPVPGMLPALGYCAGKILKEVTFYDEKRRKEPGY
jgi:hypothetical protein